MLKEKIRLIKEELGETDLKEEDINKWFDILDYVGNTVPIFWFYSYYCENDKIQADYYKKYQKRGNIYDFAINSSAHGYLMLRECNDIIISKETEELLHKGIYGRSSGPCDHRCGAGHRAEPDSQ